MALINCPECSGNVSTLAKSCPHCGYPISEEKPTQEQNPIPKEEIISINLSPKDEKPTGVYNNDTIAYDPNATEDYIDIDKYEKVPLADDTYYLKPVLEDKVQCEEKKPSKKMWFHKFNHYFRIPLSAVSTLFRALELDALNTDKKVVFIQLYLMIGFILYLCAFIGFFQKTRFAYVCTIIVIIMEMIDACIAYANTSTLTVALGIEVLILCYYIKRSDYFRGEAND